MSRRLQFVDLLLPTHMPFIEAHRGGPVVRERPPSKPGRVDGVEPSAAARTLKRPALLEAHDPLQLGIPRDADATLRLLDTTWRSWCEPLRERAPRF